MLICGDDILLQKYEDRWSRNRFSIKLSAQLNSKKKGEKKSISLIHMNLNITS